MSVSNESDNYNFINESSAIPKGKSLVRELEEKWKSIEKNNSMYKSLSLGLGTRKSKKENNIDNIILIANKLKEAKKRKETRENLKSSDFELYVKKKKKELNKFLKDNYTAQNTLEKQENEISKKIKKKTNFNLIQLKSKPICGGQTINNVSGEIFNTFRASNTPDPPILPVGRNHKKAIMLKKESKTINNWNPNTNITQINDFCSLKVKKSKILEHIKNTSDLLSSMTLQKPPTTPKMNKSITLEKNGSIIQRSTSANKPRVMPSMSFFPYDYYISKLSFKPKNKKISSILNQILKK